MIEWLKVNWHCLWLTDKSVNRWGTSMVDVVGDGSALAMALAKGDFYA